MAKRKSEWRKRASDPSVNKAVELPSASLDLLAAENVDGIGEVTKARDKLSADEPLLSPEEEMEAGKDMMGTELDKLFTDVWGSQE